VENGAETEAPAPDWESEVAAAAAATGGRPTPVPTQADMLAEALGTGKEAEAGVFGGLEVADSSVAPETPETPVEPAPVGGVAKPVLASMPKPKSDGSFELHLGRVWFVRAGIALLVTGLVFLGNYAYRNWIHDLPAGLRLAALYLCSLALGGVGAWLVRKENMRRFGEVVLAGGLAFFYWCSFAAHHVERLRVIDSPVAGALLLLVSAGVMIGISLARNARATAILGLLLASYSTVLQPLGWLSAVSNVILAATGVGLMLRPKWAGPGIAAMAGSYGAFLWWQVLGAASGQSVDPSALWFLPATWAVFVAPGLLNRFGPELTPRARAWFAGINNGVFFGLFSLVWLMRHRPDWSHFWQIPAVFGAVLLVLGIFGRRADKASGGVHFAQALSCLMFVTVLKLDGYQLALSLAGESLALAFSYLRYRGRIELVFCALALVAAVFTAFVPVGIGPLSGALAEIPVWSSGLAALILAATTVVLRYSRDGAEDIQKHVHMLGTAVLGGATVVGVGAWLLRLPGAAQFATGMGMSLVLTALALLADRRRWLPEIAWVSGVFALAAAPALLRADVPGWATIAGMAFALGACWLWHHRVPEPRKESEFGSDPATWPGPFAWMHAAIVSLAAMALWSQAEIAPRFFPAVAGLCAVAGVGIAAALRCRRLGMTTVLLHIPGLLWLLSLVMKPVDFPLDGFETPVLGLATLAMLFSPAVRERLPGASWEIVAAVSRGVAFFGWLGAWMIFRPDHWVEAIAISAAAVAAIALPGVPTPGFGAGSQRKGFRAVLPAEAWGFVAVAVGLFLFGALNGPWREWPGGGGFSWRHWAVAPAVLACGVIARRIEKNAEAHVGVAPGLFLAACAVFAIWSTQMLVWRQGWEPVGELWALLGFAYFGLGAWRRIDMVRYAGFAMFAGMIVCIMADVAIGPWSEQMGELSWRHWLIAPVFLASGMVARRIGIGREFAVAPGLFLAACAAFAIWATQMLVWRYGWKPVGVLWTLLGFAYVTAGLWQRLAVARHAGFALLAATLLKLFLVDVWDFAAFTRIASFLVLGLVLVLLGFFYNCFAEVLKKLFEADPKE
jgi:uncharacterized membrane protein